MFTDYVKIIAKSGKGGDGAVSFRREKYVAAGGPDGGDGGRGGNVYFEANPDANTLIDFRYQKKFKAGNGKNGEGANRYGKSGEDLTIKVPIGTIIKDASTRTSSCRFIRKRTKRANIIRWQRWKRKFTFCNCNKASTTFFTRRRKRRRKRTYFRAKTSCRCWANRLS